MIRYCTVTCLSLVLAVTACADNFSSRQPRQAQAVVYTGQPALLAELESIRCAAGVADVSIALVSKDDVMYVGGLGVHSLDTRNPVTADTLFRVGSITKSLLGLLLYT